MRKIKILLAITIVGAVCSAFSMMEGEKIEKKKSSSLAPPTKVVTGVAEKIREAPLVNYDYFEKLVSEVKSHRAERLVSLETFLTKSQLVGSVILDTRSKAMYDLKHVKGAIHLNFAELDKLFASEFGTRTNIYIYCNNNFFDSKAVENEFQDFAFMSKGKIAEPISNPVVKVDVKMQESLALNIPTYINLYGYGYKNVFELNEFIDVNDPEIEFEGTYDDV